MPVRRTHGPPVAWRPARKVPRRHQRDTVQLTAKHTTKQRAQPTGYLVWIIKPTPQPQNAPPTPPHPKPAPVHNSLRYPRADPAPIPLCKKLLLLLLLAPTTTANPPLLHPAPNLHLRPTAKAPVQFLTRRPDHNTRSAPPTPTSRRTGPHLAAPPPRFAHTVHPRTPSFPPRRLDNLPRPRTNCPLARSRPFVTPFLLPLRRALLRLPPRKDHHLRPVLALLPVDLHNLRPGRLDRSRIPSTKDRRHGRPPPTTCQQSGCSGESGHAIYTKRRYREKSVE